MRLRTILILTVALSFSWFHSAGAVSDMDATAGSQLRLLELKYFEHTFDNEPTVERVERIERLVRGESGQGSPQDRIKSIAADLQSDGESLAPVQSDEPAGRRAKKPTRTDGSPGCKPGGENPPPAETGDYPKVTNLEKEILSRTYAGEALTARLARLETRAFGSPRPGTDLGERTDCLESYAEQTLHDKPFAVNSEIDKVYVLGSTPKPSSSQNAIPVLEHFFNSTRRLSDEFSERGSLRTPLAPRQPAGEPGQLNQGGEPGQSDQGSERSQLVQSGEPDDDPQVYAKDPPAPSARMITRVAWCEIQTFGHTFPNMHLTRRLRQLSSELIPKMAGESDMQLMDDLDPIEKAVLARKSGQPNPTAAPPA